MFKKIKSKKKNILEFLIIILLSLVICSGFIRMHYTVDTYKVADIGYKQYAINWSLKDGRILMYVLLLIMDMCKMPLEMANYIFEIISILISTLSVMIIYNMIIEIKNTNSKIMQGIIWVISYLLVFNFMYVETFYFLETIIISTSVLIFILATKNILNKTKQGLIKAGILSIIAMFVYQGTIGFFIVFSISMLIIKNRKINKDLIKSIFYIGILVIISLLINIISVKCIDNCLGLNNTRLGLKHIANNILYIVNNMYIILTDTCGLLPKYSFIVSIVFLIVLSICYSILENKQGNITNILFIFVVSILGSFVLFVGTTTSFDCGRMYIRFRSNANVNNIIFIYWNRYFQ